MAEDEKPKGSGPMGDLMFVVVGLVLLVVLWYANGGPGKADLRGTFLQPPPPIGGGNAYGPDFASSTVDYNNQQP